MATNLPPDGGAERPRVEPEIIPPGESAEPRDARPHIFLAFDEQTTQRIHLARPSAFTMVLALALAGLAIAAILLVLLGLVLLWVPVAIIVVAVLLTSGRARQFWRWWQGRGEAR
ncbi:MAG: hypothetical protein HY056_00690 [Proteobacteria bacterium]|nr:hypothetical protein [Pseudomonadota bacterium]